MAVIVLAHGAWSSVWGWKKMRPLLRKLGHDFYAPSLTGLGARSHHARPDVDLQMHILDVANEIEFEDLNDVVLLGHSYGGMVATGVADRLPARLSQVIYLDAFVPRHGDSLFSLAGPEMQARMEKGAAESGSGWLIPPNPTPPDTAPEDLAWIAPRRKPQPIKTFASPIVLSGAGAAIRRSYIYCSKAAPGDVFGQFARMAKSDPAWRYYELDASHNPHITMPDELAALLERIVKG